MSAIYIFFIYLLVPHAIKCDTNIPPTMTMMPTTSPTMTPTLPTPMPTTSPTSGPTSSPTMTPTSPTLSPTTGEPTPIPTAPTLFPSKSPTPPTTHTPTHSPTTHAPTVPTLSPTASPTPKKKPNIIFILADDWGYNDVGWTNHNTDTLTPYLDNLATNEGLILSNYYVERVCTASRAAFLTGRYPSNLGLQSGVCAPNQPLSLTRQVSMLSNEFKYHGYSTHLIGKWHLGMQSYEYTPTYRGFDSFYGFWAGGEDYYTHISHSFMKTVNARDLFKNEKPVTNNIGVYGVWWQRDESLKLLKWKYLVDKNKPFFFYFSLQASHNPRQAPDEYVNMYANCTSSALCNFDRITFKAQTTTVDDTIKEIVEYLKESGLWDDTLIIFGSDNGGKRLYGDNAPYRGFKNTSWEGGVKVPAFITGGYLDESQRGKVLDYSMHIVDWYPTLIAAADLDITYQRSTRLYGSYLLDSKWDGAAKLPLDGMNMWPYIQDGKVDDKYFNEQKEILLDLKEVWCPYKSCGALKVGNYKYIRGNNVASLLPTYTDGDQWFRDYSLSPDKAEIFCTANYVKFKEKHGVHYKIESMNCQNTERGCLFDLQYDPCEYYDIGPKYPDLIKTLQSKLDEYEEHATISLINENNPNVLFPKEKINPQRVCTHINPDFWCPFQRYDQVTFEYALYAYNLKRSDIVSNHKHKNVNDLNKKTEEFFKQYGVILVIPIIFVVVVVIGVYFCCCHKRNKSNTGNPNADKNNENDNDKKTDNKNNKVYYGTNNKETYNLEIEPFLDGT